MKDGIDTVAASLGDFPLDPDSGAAWLWSADGMHLLWASREATDILALKSQNDASAVSPLLPPERFRGLAVDLATAEPDQQPVRVQQIRLSNGGQPKDFTCISRPVRLLAGGYAVLAVAIGAPARSLKAMQGAQHAPPHPPRRDFRTRMDTLDATPSDPNKDGLETRSRFEPLSHLQELLVEPLAKAELSARGVIDTRVSAKPSPLPPDMAAASGIPAKTALTDKAKPSTGTSMPWTRTEAHLRRPLRFVWQTDAEGRFVHLSRELAEAVGPSNAMLLGQTWAQAVSRLGIREAETVQNAMLTHETWTAQPVLWPVSGDSHAIPVELAGTPVVRHSQFAGFRGYGIARIEKAVNPFQSVETAMTQDVAPVVETGFQHFGPAIEKALTDPSTTTMPIPSEPTMDPIRRVPNPLPLLPTFSEAVTQTEKGDTSVKPALTLTEREAFREIARALEKPQAEEAKATPPEKILHGESTSEQASPPSVDPVQSPQEWPKAGSLQALKNDLASRSKLRLGARTVDEAPRETPSHLQASLVPYNTLQSRRENRSRSDGTHAAWVTMMDRLPLGMLVTQDAKVVFANRYLLDMTGHADMTSLRESGGVDQLFARRGATQPDEPGVFSVTSSKGETVLVDAAIHVTSWNETPATLITLRRASESTSGQQYKALELDLLSARAELRELQSVLDTATDGIIAIDGDGRILTLNRSAEALFGFDQNELTGESLTVLLEPDSHLIAMDYLEGLRSNGVRSILNDGRDVKGRERNGGILPLFMTIGRVGESHPATRFCVVLRDITHWKKVEADLTEAKRQAEDSSANKTDFLTTISHEIRTPLNAIIGFSQVMMTESFGPIGNERYRQYAKDINASGEHVVSLVNDLLDLSKVASGRLELSFASVDINAILSSCVAMIQPQANAGKVIVRSQLAAHLPSVVADERSIRQIALNLLSNAAKFTEAGGQVIASTSFTDQGEVVIRVRDTGIGMAEDEVKRAMQPFHQIPGPRSAGGTGLGLPLTKALVEANRAGFTIKSEPRVGTLIEVIFPSTRVLAE